MEMLEHVAKVGGIAIALATIIAAVIGWYSFKHNFREAVQTLLFIKYTERYEQIMSLYPPEALAVRLDNDGEPPPASEPLTLAALKYLNLCCEESYMKDKGYLHDGVWQMWEEEMQRTLRSPLYRREWSKLRKEFESYKAFLDYVEEIQREVVSFPSQPNAQPLRVDRPSKV